MRLLLLIKDFEESDVLIFVGANPLHRAPDHVATSDAQSAQPEDHRGRSSQDGDGYGGYSSSCDRSEVGSDSVLRTRGARHRAGLIDQSFIDANTNDFEAFKEFLEDYGLERASEQRGSITMS